MIIAKTKDNRELRLLPPLANRHGLISGTTGSGKTVTLRVMAENFSRMGVPVFLSDIKGDLSGLVKAGEPTPRAVKLGYPDFEYRGFPVVFWDLYGQRGSPIRTTVDSLGDLMLSRLLDLNKVQSGIMTLLFKVCQDNNFRNVDFTDIKPMLKYLADHAFDFKAQYGNIGFSSVGAIQREILTLQRQGVDQFFNEPVFDIANFFLVNQEGYGAINILHADTLIKAPKLYCTFLLWLLSELYERLPEVGDLPQPKFVFFFDEAHLLFKDIPKILLDKIEQIVRLIRSKGVGVYFITQSALDIHDNVLGQLGNRVQHALRAFTPRDRRTVKAVAETFRDNPKFKTATAIGELKTGEALISFLDEEGAPSVVEKAMVLPPQSRLEPLTTEEIRAYNGHIPEEEKKIDEDPIIITKSGPVGTEKFVETFGRGLVRSMGNRAGNEIIRGVFNTFLRGSRGALGK